MSDTVKIRPQGKRHLWVSIGIISSALVLIYFLQHGLKTNPNEVPSALINKPAKDFTVDWLQGQEFLNSTASPTFSLHDFKGRPVILNFWASWCYSCRAEARDFEAFWQEYKDRDIYVAGIAIQDTETKALGFARQYGKTYILGLDTQGEVAIDYGVTGVPETFLIDSNGYIIDKVAGPVDKKKLEEFAERLLALSKS